MNVCPQIHIRSTFFVNACFLNFFFKLHKIWIFLSCPNNFQPEMHVLIVNASHGFWRCTSVGTGIITVYCGCLFWFGFDFDCKDDCLILPIWSDCKNDPEPPGLLTTKHASWHHVQLALKKKLIWQIKNKSLGSVYQISLNHPIFVTDVQEE